jgi:hypothetical protein
LGEIFAEPISNIENTQKQLETDNIKDYKSKIRDQNIIINPKQIHMIDLEHFSN